MHEKELSHLQLMGLLAEDLLDTSLRGLFWNSPASCGVIRVALELGQGKPGERQLNVSGFCPSCCPEQLIAANDEALKTALVAVLISGMKHHPSLF